jgi:septin 2
MHNSFPISDCKIFLLLKERIAKTLSISSKTVELEEKGVRLKLTVVDTPGFGDSVNTNEWFVKYFTNV